MTRTRWTNDETQPPRARSAGIDPPRTGRETGRKGRPAGEGPCGCRGGEETASGTERAKWDRAKQLPRAAKDMEGLSLIEVAIALAVSALLLGGLMVPLAAQIDRYRLRETEAALGQALEALLGYAAAHDNRLPCPDIDGDGTEDRPGTAASPCRGVEGELPRATLGIPGRDGWGRPLRYRGNDALTRPGGMPRPPGIQCGSCSNWTNSGHYYLPNPCRKTRTHCDAVSIPFQTGGNRKK